MSKKKVIKEEPVLPLYIFFTIGKSLFHGKYMQSKHVSKGNG